MKKIQFLLSLIFLFVLFSTFSSMNSERFAENQFSKNFYLAYISSKDFRGITPLNLETGATGTPIFLEHNPKSIFISPDAKVAYILQENSNEITPINLETGEIHSSIVLEKNLQDMVIFNGQTAYVIYEGLNQINVLDLVRGSTKILTSLENSPFKIFLSPNKKTLYVSYEELNEITPLDVASSIIQPSIYLNDIPKIIGITSDEKLIYVGNNASNYLHIYDLENGELESLTTQDINDSEKVIQGINISPYNDTIYLIIKDSNEIAFINSKNKTTKFLITPSKNIQNIAIYPKDELIASFSENIALVGENSSFDASTTVSFKGGILTYTWNFGDGHQFSSESPFVTHAYSSSDNFEVTLTVTEMMENFNEKTLDKTFILFATTTKSIEVLEKRKDATEPSNYDLENFNQPVAGPLLLSEDTITTLNSSSTPAIFGEPITLTANVSSVIVGIPTGTVTFVDAVLGILGTGTLDINGNATFTTATLPVGTYSLSANYGGSSNFNPSSSAPPIFVQIVNQALTATIIATNPNPSFFGNSINLTATVSVISPGAGTPTGTISFYDGTTLIGTSTITGNQATLSTSSLISGSHTISAVYNGDINFLTSKSSNLAQTVSQATTTTNVTTSLTPTPFGSSVTFTATLAITNGAGVPTGTVTFKDGLTTLGTQPVSSNTAIFSISNLAVGTHTITATYNGDTNFTSSISSGLTQVIGQGTTNTAIASSVNPSTYGQSVSFTANVTVVTGSGTPTGTITFKDGATTLGSSSIAAGSTITVSNLAVASHTITATYNGDTNFSTSTSTGLTQVVGKATPLASVTSSLSPSNYGDKVTFTATISAPTTLGLPSGSVNFYSDSVLIGTGILSGISANSATATFSLSTLNAGTHSITIQYSGDGNFTAATNPSTPTFSQIVNAVNSTRTIIFSNSPNPSEFGQPVIFRATVTGSTASSPLPPTGTISFYDGAILIGTASLIPVTGIPNSSTSSFTNSVLAIGSHVITAHYSGDVNYPASISGVMTQNVIQSSTSSTVTTSITPSKFGQTVTFTATVNALSPGGGAPGGTVSFYDGVTFLGTSTLTPGSNLSTGSFSTSNLSLGTHSILGIYSGDTNFTSSSTPTITQVVVQDSTLTTITTSSSSPPGFQFGDFITFTASVAASSPGSGTPTGTVQFFEGTTLIGTGTLSNGIATTTTVMLYPGTHLITAVYSGDTNFITSTTASAFSQTITGTLPTSTTISSSRNASPTGDNVTYTAQVVAAPGPGMGIPGIPTGTVTFTDTTLGVIIGTGTLNADGQASITELGNNLLVSPLTHLIQATYNGQTGVFNPSTSSLFNQYIVPYDTTTVVIAMPNPTTQGGVTLTATVTVIGSTLNPTGTVSFYDGTTFLGTAPVVAGIASIGTAILMPNDLHFGSRTITAVYSGDTAKLLFATSTDTFTPLQVQQTDMLTTQTTLSSSLSSSIVCQPVTFTALVTDTEGFYTPTGSVTFFNGDVAIGTAILDNTGTAQLTVTTLPVGTLSINATYNSDSNYAFSFSNTITQTVTANNTSMIFSIIPNLASTPYGENLILSAAVASTPLYTVTPTGTVTFSSGTTVIATVALDSTGEATYEISNLDVGTYTVTATYNPDPCFLTSTANLSHTIIQINPNTSLTSTPNPSVYGDVITLTATISSPVGTPTGSVTFFNGSTPLGTVFIEGGSASLEITSPLAGVAILEATYSGDINFKAISLASEQQVIDKAPTSTCLVTYTTNPSEYGELVTFNASVSSSASTASPNLTGSITFTNGSILLGTVPLNNCDSAILTTSNLNLGSANSIVATYSGDSNFATSTSSALSQTVIQSATNTNVTSITSTPNPPTFGTLVTFNVAITAVSPGSGIPTGTITGFYGSTIIGTGTLVNGTATFSTSTLPAGVQTIVIKYSGDTNFTASQTVTTGTIIAAPTTSTLISSNNPSVFGQPVTFNATVTSTQGIPTGTVAFLDGTTTLATETLNSTGVASFTTSSLAIGTHSIKAVYSGSTNLASSTTSTISQVVNKDSTSTALTSSLNPSFYGETFILTAAVTANAPGSGVPSGIITFKNGATTLGTGILNSSGQATLSISTSLNANITPYALTAVYSGDGNFLTSTGSLNQTVSKAPTTISATYTPNPVNFGAPLTLNIKVAALNIGSGIPSGTVQVAYGSQIVSGSLANDGTVTFNIPALSAGTLVLIIEYLGDTNFLPSSLPITETVTQANTTTILSALPTSSKFGQAVTFSANVSSSVGEATIPTGSITFFDGTTIIGTQALDMLGNTTFTTSSLSTTTHQIIAVYNGDAINSSSASSALSYVVSQNATTTTLTSILNPSVYGESVTFSAVVNPNAPGTGLPTGTVTFKNGGATILGGVITLNSYGEALFTLSSLPVGLNSITAVYSADTNFIASTGSLNQTVAKTPTITNVTLPTSTVTFGTAIPITGSVSTLNNGATTIPTGTITAYYGSTTVGSGSLNGSGQYAFSLTGLPAGTSSVELKYSGDANFNSSATTVTQTVNAVTSMITLSSSPNPSLFDQTVTITSTVTLPSGTPTGTVTYYDGSTILGTTAVNQPLVISTLSVGTHPLTAVYSGSSNVAGATSGVIDQMVNLATTTTSLTSSLNPSTYGNNVIFTATVAAPSGTPTGFVTFQNGSTTLGTGILNSSGIAQFSISTLSAGTNSITAIYSSDSNFTTSTSPLLLQVVNQAPASATTTTILSSAPNPSVFGQNVNFFANVTSPNGTPTGTITYFDGTTPLSTVPIYDGFAILSISSLAPGNHNIRAVYNGDSNFNASLPSTIYMQVVQPVTTTVTTVTHLTSSNNPANYGDPVTFDIQVTSALVPPPYPTGFVTLFTGSTPLVTLPLNGTGGATYTTSSLPAGNLQIVALYSGDATFSASTDAILQVVNAISTTTSLVSSENPSNFGDFITFTATVTSGSGLLTPTGSVSFYDGAVLLDTVLLSNAGLANFIISNLSKGSHTINAIYNADPNFSSSSNSVIQVVNTSPTMTTIITSSPNPSNVGDSVALIASTSAIAGVPTGIVTFYDGGTPIGSTTLFGGLAILSTSSLTVGSHSITATYAGNTNYSPSISSPYIQQVINGATILQDPRGFCGCQKTCKNLNKTDRVNILKWQAPGAGAEPTFYKIYRNSQLTDLVATIPACGPLKYEDGTRKKNKIYTYYLIAGNQNGTSGAVSVTVDPKKNKCSSIGELVIQQESLNNWHLNQVNNF